MAMNVLIMILWHVMLRSWGDRCKYIEGIWCFHLLLPWRWRQQVPKNVGTAWLQCNDTRKRNGRKL